MALTPRGEEVAAVVDLLEAFADEAEDEDGEEFTPADVARAVFLKVAWLLSMRDGYAVVLNRRYAYGPYFSESEATKLATQLGELGQPATIQLFSPGVILAKLGPEVGTHWFDFCTCSHPKDMHLADGSSRGKCGYTMSEQCECEKYVEAAPKKAPRKTKKKAVAAPATVEDAAA